MSYISKESQTSIFKRAVILVVSQWFCLIIHFFPMILTNNSLFPNDLDFTIIHCFPSVFNGGGRGDDSGGGSGADWEHILYLCSCQVLIYLFLSLHFSLLYKFHFYCVLIFCRKCRSNKSINCSMSVSLSLLGNSFSIFLLAKVFFCRRNEPAVYLVPVHNVYFGQYDAPVSLFIWFFLLAKVFFCRRNKPAVNRVPVYPG